MKNDILNLLEKQAAWQRSRKSKSWAEKLRLSVAMRPTLQTLRQHAMDKKTNTLVHYTIRVTGVVQGVGYRYATHREATALGLTGWVRNEDDGSVAIEAEGKKEIVDQFVAWCRRGPRGAVVSRVECHEGPLQGFTGFDIIP